MSAFGFHTQVASFGVWQLNLPLEIFPPYPLTFSDHRISEKAWEAGSPLQHPGYTDEDREVQR